MEVTLSTIKTILAMADYAPETILETLKGNKPTVGSDDEESEFIAAYIREWCARDKSITATDFRMVRAVTEDEHTRWTNHL